MRPSAATVDIPLTEGNASMIMADAAKAKAAAATYRHTASMIDATRRRAGLPAYQSAGIVNTQRYATHATATPTGPHGRPTRNSRVIIENSTIPQRKRRSALPRERCVQICTR